MMITKEKVLAVVSGLVASIVLASVEIPSLPDVEPVPREEPAAVYTSAPGTLRPNLAPEKTFTTARDPFRVKDPWSTAPPARLAVPPATPWPRAVPGGVAKTPRSPLDRVLVNVEGGTK
jgi:hypothetical protein